MSAEWSNGLCGCFNNCTLCLVAYVAPCYVQGKNAEAVEEDCLICGLLSLIPIANIVSGVKIRGKIREQKGIGGSVVNDVLAVLCCPLCAVVQEAQEVANTSFTQSIDRA